MSNVIDFKKARNKLLGFSSDDALEEFMSHPLTAWCNKITEDTLQIEELGIFGDSAEGTEEIYFLIRGDYKTVDGITERILERADNELKEYSVINFAKDLQDDFTFSKLFLFLTENKEPKEK